MGVLYAGLVFNLNVTRQLQTQLPHNELNENETSSKGRSSLSPYLIIMFLAEKLKKRSHH